MYSVVFLAIPPLKYIIILLKVKYKSFTFIFRLIYNYMNEKALERVLFLILLKNYVFPLLKHIINKLY